jgi:predicted amidohydrolase YtcJ
VTGSVTGTGTLLITNVAVNGLPGLDVRADPGTILEIGHSLPRRDGELAVDGGGGEVIPGLHDHHVHLRAAVAARASVDVSAAANPAEFDALVSAAAARASSAGASSAGASSRAWLRITGWYEHAAGAIDRYRLDVLAGPVPVRVQHRSGAMWVLNSAALRQADVDACDLPGVERDDQGAPTGRLLRLDGWLRDRLAARQGTDSAASFAVGLAEYAAAAARAGITGFTEATPGRDQADIDEYARLADAGVLPQRLLLMAPSGLRRSGTARVTLGPQKLILDDATLPAVADLATAIADAHRAGSSFAIHCVTAEQLLISIAALEQAGPAGDRIEHAGIVPPGCARDLSRLGIAVITNPGFIADRGHDYLREVPVSERDWLYPCASLIEAGVAVAAGTDAPFGPADPWLCIAAAMTRRTAAGTVLGRSEQVPGVRALRLFLADPGNVARTRTVAPGQPSDLCILRQPLRSVLAEPSAAAVQATIVGGRVITRP